MIAIIFAVGLYFLLVEKVVRKFFYSLIMDCTTVNEALFLRKMYFISIWFVTILYWGGYVVLYVMYLANDTGDYSFSTKINGIAIAIVGAIQYWKQNKWDTPNGKVRHIFNISYSSLKHALKIQNGFVLFLRGFEHDDYTDEFYLKKKQCFKEFSEYHFVKAMDRYKSTFAVGITNELEQPSGARRIYLDDLTWREGVKQLMEKSVAIVILMNDKKSCLWEIEQSASILNKTYFLVDSSLKYDKIRNSTKNIINFPELDYQKLPLLIHFKENEIVLFPYKNNISDYNIISNKIALNISCFSDFEEVKKINVDKKNLGIVTLLVYIYWNYRLLSGVLLFANLIVTLVLVQSVSKASVECYFALIYIILCVSELLLFALYYQINPLAELI